MKVDFHVHSVFSDGTFTPEEIARMMDGFAAGALTDHDNADGTAGFLAAASGFRPVCGIELSIEPGKGFDKFHLLGLGIDPASPALAPLLSKIVEGRNGRNRAIIANFRKIGIEIPLDGISAYANGDILARPHFARWLVDHGFASSVKGAFETYLTPFSPPATRCYEERWHPPQEDAFAAIHAAGGLCVMAHPKYWKKEWLAAGPDMKEAVREFSRLKECGLDGLEAVYQANTQAENVAFTLAADRTGLLKTAGSDFHGANKPGIQIGMDVDARFISPFLAALERQSAC